MLQRRTEFRRLITGNRRQQMKLHVPLLDRMRFGTPVAGCAKPRWGIRFGPWKLEPFEETLPLGRTLLETRPYN